MAKKSIDEKAVLVKLVRSRWWAKKTDKQAGLVLCNMSSADDSMVSVSKLLVDASAFARINTLYNSVQQYYKKMTLAWSDDAYRILPSSDFTEFVRKMNEFRSSLDNIVDDLVDIYPQLIPQSKNLLGDLWDESDYPTATALKQEFKLNIYYRPVPVVNDFRVDLSNDDSKHLEEAFKAELNENLKSALGDIWARIEETLSHVHKMLSEDKQIRTALIGNVNIMIDTVSRLNITDDANVKQIVRDIKAKVVQYDTETLKTNEVAKAEVKNATKEILDNMKVFMGI
jgi:hypothetical protein